MSISARMYLFLHDGSLRRVPQRIAFELPGGGDAIPEFAGTSQRMAQVIIESDNRRPVRILDARGFHWSFDAEGHLDEEVRHRWHQHLDLHFSSSSRAKQGQVVDLVPQIKKRDLDARTFWTLTAEDLDRIAADLWPGVHGPAPEVSTVKGAKPKTPPLTNDARCALQRLNGHVNAIKNELQNLSERALKGLAFEALRTGLWEDELIWRGVADFAKHAEAIRAAHRTGRGEWYAVVEVARASRDYAYLFEEIAVAHEKCPSRHAAVEAGRKLMAEKAGWVDADMEISVNIRSALEWRPEEWE